MSFKFTLQPTYYCLNSDSYGRSFQIKPEIFWQINGQFASSMSYTYQDDTFFEDNGKSGLSNEIEGNCFLSIFEGKGPLFGGFGATFYDAENADESYDQWKLKFGLSANLPYEFEISFTGEMYDKKYEAEEDFEYETRDDDRYMAEISVTRKLYEDWLKIGAEYSFTKKDSDYVLKQYERNMIMIFLASSRCIVE